MFRLLHRLFADLFLLRRYRRQRQARLPWRIYLPYERNRIRHGALDHWPGGYAMTEHESYIHVPPELDAMSGRRLLNAVGEDPLIPRWCPPGGVAIDIGANIGDWSLPLAKAVGPQGRLIAVEPIPRMAASLRKTFGVNNLRQAAVAELALSDTPGRASFAVERHNTGGSRLGAHDSAHDAIEVEVSTLDRLALERYQLTRLDFLKIDVEGHERAALAGGRATLARFKPLIVMESGQETGDDRGAIADLLQGLDYEIAGFRVAGGIVETNWADYRANAGLCAEAGIANLVFFPKLA